VLLRGTAASAGERHESGVQRTEMIRPGGPCRHGPVGRPERIGFGSGRAAKPVPGEQMPGVVAVVATVDDPRGAAGSYLPVGAEVAECAVEQWV
jgi:hypothetical protein